MPTQGVKCSGVPPSSRLLSERWPGPSLPRQGNPWCGYPREAGFGAQGRRAVPDGSGLPAWRDIVGRRGRTVHPTSSELDSLGQLRSRAPLGVSEGSQCGGASLSADGSQSVGAGWGWPLALRPGTSGDPAPAHLPPSATAVGGQGCGQSGQRQPQRSRNPAGQQRPVPHGLPGLACSVLKLGRLWLLPATVGRVAAVAAVARIRSLALTALGAGGGQHGSRSQLVG